VEAGYTPMNIEHLRGVLPSHDPGCRVVVSVFGQDWEVSQVTYGRSSVRLEVDTQAGRLWRTVRRSWWRAASKAELPETEVYAAWSKDDPWPPLYVSRDFHFTSEASSRQATVEFPITVQQQAAQQQRDLWLGRVLLLIVFIPINALIIFIVIFVLGALLGFLG